MHTSASRGQRGFALIVVLLGVLVAGAHSPAGAIGVADDAGVQRLQDVVIESQGFEGSTFPPAGWTVVDNLADPSQFEWARETCEVEAGFGGTAAAWALGGGSGGSGLTCGSAYTAPVDTSLVYGPIDTTGYPGGLRVNLHFWLDTPEVIGPEGLPVDLFLVCATYDDGVGDYSCWGTGLLESDWTTFDRPCEFPHSNGRGDGYDYVWLTYFDRVPEGGHVGVFVDNIVIEGVGGSGGTTPPPTVQDTPIPSPSATPSPTGTGLPSHTPSATGLPTSTATWTPPTSPTASRTPSPTDSPTGSPSPTVTTGPSPSATDTAQVTGTGTTAPTGTGTHTATTEAATSTQTPEVEPSQTGVVTLTPSGETPVLEWRIYLPITARRD